MKPMIHLSGTQSTPAANPMMLLAPIMGNVKSPGNICICKVSKKSGGTTYLQVQKSSVKMVSAMARSVSMRQPPMVITPFTWARTWSNSSSWWQDTASPALLLAVQSRLSKVIYCTFVNHGYVRFGQFTQLQHWQFSTEQSSIWTLEGWSATYVPSSECWCFAMAICG